MCACACVCVCVCVCACVRCMCVCVCMSVVCEQSKRSTTRFCFSSPSSCRALPALSRRPSLPIVAVGITRHTDGASFRFFAVSRVSLLCFILFFCFSSLSSPLAGLLCLLRLFPLDMGWQRGGFPICGALSLSFVGLLVLFISFSSSRLCSVSLFPFFVHHFLSLYPLCS